jgi:hypothetical protein
MRKTVYSIFYILLLNSYCFGNITDELIFGQHPVGFQVQEHIDTSRNYRTIQIYTWYPAKLKQAQKRTTVSDYLQNHFVKRGSKKEWESVLSQETNSFVDAKKAEKSFPLIIISQGYHFESAISLAILAEYIASYGYIVSTCPLRGTNQASVVFNLEDLETQILDLEFVVNKSTEINQTISNIGLIGFDLGGLSAALLSMSNPSIKCLVSLDGGLIFKHNLDYIKKSSYYKPLKLQAPLLQITRFKENNEIMGMTEDFSFFDSTYYSDKYLLRFESINHNEFTSYNIMGIDNNGSGKLTIHKGDINKAVPIFHDYIRQFLSAYIENDHSSFSFLCKPIQDQNFEIAATLDLIKSKIPGQR